MSKLFKRKSKMVSMIKSAGIHFLSLIIFFSVFVANVKPDLAGIVLNLAGVLLCLLLLFAKSRQVPLRGFGLILPFMLLIVWAVLQCIDLPINFVKWLAPASGEIWQLNPLNDFSTADAKVPLNLCAVSGVNQLQLYWLAAVVMIAACTFITNSREFEKFGINLVLIAIGVSILALAQQFLGNGKIYWVVEDGHQGKGGPFLNYSNMGQFLIIGIGVGMIMLLHQWHASHGHGGNSRLSFKSRLLAGAPKVKFAKPVCFLLLISAMALVFSTGRMALVATGTAYLITLLVLSRYGPKAKIDFRVLAILLVMVFVFLITIDFGGRLASISGGDPFRLRKDQILTISQIIQSHPLTGIGVGALRYVYPYYNEFPLPRGMALHESDVWYFQLVAEVGLIGMLFVIAMLIQIFVYLRRLSRDKSRNMMVYGYIFMIVGLSLSFATDFGLQKPAIFLSLAIMFGVLKSMVTRSDQKVTESKRLKSGQILILSGFLILSLITTVDMYSQWQSSRLWDRMLSLDKKINQETNLEAKKRLLHRASELGAMAVKIDNRDLNKMVKWFELKIKGYLLASDDKSDIDELERLLAGYAKAAPSFYRSVSIQATLIILGAEEGHVAKARQLLEQAVRHNKRDRLTLIRLSFVLIHEGETSKAKAHLKEVIKMDSGTRVIDLLAGMNRWDLLLELLPESQLDDIAYAYHLLHGKLPDHKELITISGIYISKFEASQGQEMIDRKYASYAGHLARVGRMEDALGNITVAIRKGRNVHDVKRWRLKRIEIYENILEVDEVNFRSKYMEVYKTELRKLIRVFPERDGLKKKLAKLNQ